jgi:hypothetical protein
VADWVCILSPWLAFVGLIIWDTREKGFRSPLGVLRDVDPNRIVALGTLLLALGTFALAWVAFNTDKATHSLAEAAVKQAEATDKQAGVMQGQLDAMRADQRAWVFVVSADPVRDLFFADGRSFASVKFQLKNAGRTPARFATIAGEFLMRGGTAEDIRKGCAKHHRAVWIEYMKPAAL